MRSAGGAAANEGPEPQRASCMVITEIFKSIQGEGTRAGRPCIFVRLTGSNLRSVGCDTVYALHGGRRCRSGQFRLPRLPPRRRSGLRSACPRRDRPETHIEIATPVITSERAKSCAGGLNSARRSTARGRDIDLMINDEACGTCDSCRLRHQPFGEALLRDPVPYRARVAQ
jgi:hypothetical protein